MSPANASNKFAAAFSVSSRTQFLRARHGSGAAAARALMNIWRDGVLLLNTILALFRDYKPLTFSGAAGLLLLGASLIPGVPVALGFTRPGDAAHLLAVILAAGLILCGVLSISVSFILRSIARRAQEFEHSLQVLRDELSHRPTAAPAAAGRVEERRAVAKGTSLGD